jgi:hypothetical protein
LSSDCAQADSEVLRYPRLAPAIPQKLEDLVQTPAERPRDVNLFRAHGESATAGKETGERYLARSSLVRMKNQPTRICAESIYTTMILAGSLQAPMTPLRPTVRTRTQMTVPGVKPLNVALPPLKEPLTPVRKLDRLKRSSLGPLFR